MRFRNKITGLIEKPKIEMVLNEYKRLAEIYEPLDLKPRDDLKPTQETTNEVDLETLSFNELRKLAKDKGLEVGANPTKETLLEALAQN